MSTKTIMVVWESRKKSQVRSTTVYEDPSIANNIAEDIRKRQKRRVDVIPLTPDRLRRFGNE